MTCVLHVISVINYVTDGLTHQLHCYSNLSSGFNDLTHPKKILQ